MQPRASRLLRVLASALAWGISAASVFPHGTLHDELAVLTAALKEKPDDARLLFQLADVYARHEEWANALETLARVEALAPNQFSTDLVRGNALATAGRHAEARLAFDRFIAAHPDDHDARLGRARSLVALGATAAALYDYRAVLRGPGAPSAEVYAEAAEALGREQWFDEAIAALDAGIAACGEYPFLLERALVYEITVSRWDAALARIAALQRQAVRPEPWMARRAEVLARAGRLNEARAAWTALLDHLAGLPNLERGLSELRGIAAQAQVARAALEPVVAPAPSASVPADP